MDTQDFTDQFSSCVDKHLFIQIPRSPVPRKETTCTFNVPPSLSCICPRPTYHPYLSNPIGSFVLDVHILTGILVPHYIEVQPIEEDMADSAGAISIAGRLIQRRQLITHSIPGSRVGSGN